ncbi:hypothetical protein G6F56_008457 [Rhizopus delemar]|nr:hypothetical protein G6F56_008457 [Rhizopus delemar]
MTFPSSLFIQFIEQGIKERLVLDITRTLDGEYYLDETYIAKTISKHVEAKGKISVETLASLLNLEQDTITCLIQKISLDKKWSFVDDLVLTQAYVNDAAKQVQMVLNKTGIISIVSQSQSMKLPYSLLKSIVFGLKGYVQYSVLPDTLMTEEYRINNKLKIQEALRAIEEPFPLFKVQKSLYILEDIFYLWVDEVMKENALGFLRGKRSRAIFEPKEYKEQQLNFIKSIFDSNGFVSFDGIENLYSFVNPVDLIKDNYKSDTYYILNSCVIKTHIKDNTRDMIQSMNDYCDVNDLLPSSLTLEDVNKVIDLCVQELASVQKIITLEGGYVTTPEYAQSLSNSPPRI